MLLSLVDERNSWVRRILGVAFVLVVLQKFFFGTLLGVLILSWLLYLGIPYLTEVEPWTFSQLVLWFDELNNDAKIGMAGSLVTVLGFFIALHTTMHSWQRQTAATMRMAASDIIDGVVSEVSAVLLRISHFTGALADEIERVRTQGIPAKAAPLLSVLSEDLIEFRADRRRLVQLEQEVIALPARYSVLFLPLSGVASALESIADNISDVTRIVWVAAPAGGTGNPEHRLHLLEQIDATRYRALSDTSDAARDKIGGLQGAVRGALMSPLFEANAFSFGRVIRLMTKRPGNDDG